MATMTEKELEDRREYHRIYRVNMTDAQKEAKKAADKRRYGNRTETQIIAKNKRAKFTGWMDYRRRIMAKTHQ